MRLRPGRALQIAGWVLVWLTCFWAFLLLGFPSDAAKAWLVENVGQRLDAAVSIETLRMRWNLDVRLDGVSVARPALAIRFTSLTVHPKWLGLLSSGPRLDFTGDTASGGHLSGSYKPGEVTLRFSNMSAKDLGIAPLPLPPGATVRGSGTFRLATTSATIETEIDGVPGGRQRLQIFGKDALGLAGTLKITVSGSRL